MKRTILLTLALLVCSTASATASGLTLVGIPGPSGTTPFKSTGGFGPTFAVSPPNDPHRLFVGTQDGYVYLIKDGVLQATPFLDLHTQVSTGNENGMFSMAFAPDYATSRRFYVSYSDTSNPTFTQLKDVHVDGFMTQVANADLADASTQRQILFVADSACEEESSPHYGGQLQFGPDGHLWVSIGDGGDGCSGAQSKQALHLDNIHGKILRFDPEPTQAAPDADGNRLSIPTDDPLYTPAGPHTAVQAIWAYGLRNPYRFSFDSVTHDLWIGDVGNSMQEEIDHVATTPVPTAPVFFGWPCMEGSLVFFYGGCDQPAATAENGGVPLPAPVGPVATFTHDATCAAVIGGIVLHDAALGGDFDGRYLYGYFCGPGVNGELLTLNPASPGAPRDEGLTVGMFRLSSFGTDACGHPYATNVGGGGLNRIQGAITPTCGHPRAQITSAPSGVVGAAATSVAVVAGEPATFMCSLDGGAASACTSPVSRPVLPEGPHSVAITATNPFGDTDASPPTASWIVDTGPPDTTITAGPPALDDHSAATFAFTGSESDTTFTCRLDAGVTSACTSPKTYSGVSDGAHTVTVIATDAAGNADATPATRSWTIDTAAPQTTITNPPTGTVGTTGASIVFSSSEAGSAFTCSLDGAAATTCTSPKAYAGLADGAHTVSVIATDAAGNADPSAATANWTVDTTAPQTTISNSPTGTVAATGASIAFTSSEAGSTFSCSLDGAGATACTSPMSYSGLSDGPHTFSVIATDTAGNPDPSPATRTWTVDSIAPDTTIASGPPASDTSITATFTFTASESATFSCSLDGLAAQPCTSPTSYTDLPEGAHRLAVTASDVAGNVDPTPAVATWTLELPHPPPATPTAPTTPTRPVKPPPAAIHISFGTLKSLTMDTHGKLRMLMSKLAQNAHGTLTLRSGTRALASVLHFEMKAGSPKTLVLSLSATARRAIVSHHGQRARIVLTMVGEDRKIVTASATIRVLPPPL